MKIRSDVVARYSLLKCGALFIGSSALALSILLTGFRNHWHPQTTRLWLDLLAYGAAPIWLCTMAVFAFNLLRRKGVAIARDNNFLLLNTALGQKRVPLKDDISVASSTRDADMSGVPNSVFFKIRPAQLAQVTISVPGKPDLVFPTMLLSQDAESVASRITSALGLGEYTRVR